MGTDGEGRNLKVNLIDSEMNREASARAQGGQMWMVLSRDFWRNRLQGQV